MDTSRQKYRDDAFSSMDAAIRTLNIAKEVSGFAPARAAFHSVTVILTTITDSIFDALMLNRSITNEEDYIELGLACVDVCTVLDRGSSGELSEGLNNAACEAINQLRAIVAEIQKKIVKQVQRNAVSRLIHAKGDKETIAAWRSDLDRILHISNTELPTSTNAADTVMYDVYCMMGIEERAGDGYWSTQTSTPGESPPPPPRVLFGRNELVEKIVYRAESLFPFALIGAGGIGKTSIALTVLHDDRIKQRFGDNRRFIRCDQFPASLAHFIGQISKATGAGVKNPKDMASLLRFLPSEEIFVVLDSAESILDPRGANVQEIYAAVEELSRFSNICLCITSRTPTIPPACESLDIPILSMEAARAAFYHIYKNGGQSNTVNSILEQLNFHALSITLLATVAHHNEWGTNQLGREWERQRMGSLRTLHSNSLAATIGFSLASPTFQELGPDARELLGITAFFPQGVNENNLDRFFPTTPDRRNIFDRFCVLSLTYRNDGFITMLAPLRDYFSPKDPTSSSLLRTIKEYYFSQLSIRVNPGDPDFEGVRWVASEGVNIEHLLSVFASTDVGSDDVWDACANFMRHLYRHKPWLAVLESKIEGLPDHHPSKPHCFFRLSQLFGQIWNGEERMRLLIHTLRLWGERGDDFEVAQALMRLADASWFHVHGIRQAKKALEIFERLGRRTEQAQCLQCLARLLKWDKAQRDAAEEAASRSLDLLLDKDEEFLVCEYYYTLGGICNSKDEIGKANNHFKTALGIASSFGWQDRQFWIHHSLATMFFHKQRFDDAQAHAERAKVYAVNDARLLGCAMNLRAIVLYSQRRYEEAKSEALRAADVHEKLGDTGGLDASEEYLDLIERATSNLAYINTRALS